MNNLKQIYKSLIEKREGCGGLLPGCFRGLHQHYLLDLIPGDDRLDLERMRRPETVIQLVGLLERRELRDDHTLTRPRRPVMPEDLPPFIHVTIF